jgi:HAE1 family hydrophobic/amphiphilic exporter-1
VKWATYFLRHPVAAVMLNLSFICAGLFSYTRLNLDSMPEVDIAIVTIDIALDGANPSVIQSTITKPVEDAVAVISGIDTINSTSTPGLSETVVQFELSKNSDQAIQDCRDKVDAITDKFPKGTKKPTYVAYSSNQDPAAKITVSSDKKTLAELTQIVKQQVMDPLQSVSGVGQVTLYGDQQRQIHVVLDARRLREHHVSVGDVTQSIVAANSQVPGGLVTSKFQEYSLNVKGQLQTVADFGAVVVEDLVTSPDGQDAALYSDTPIRVNQLASVFDSEAELRSLARLNANPTLTLSIMKTTDANLVELVGGLQTELTELQKTLPADVRLELIEDSAGPVERILGELQEHLVLGSFLACLVVLIALKDLRLTAIAATAIPVSLIGSFAVMDALGYTLNTMTLLAVTLAVGLVIDDAIVVLENTHKMMQERGIPALEAAEASLEEIGSAVVATTVSLVILFLPLSLMPGEVGLYFRAWGIVMATTIIISLVVSFTLTPVLCAKMLPPPGAAKPLGRVEQWAQDVYGAMLGWALRWRFLVILMALGTLVWGGYLAKVVGKEFTAAEDVGNYSVTVRFPQGWPPSRIAEALDPIEKTILALPHIESVLTTVDATDLTTGNLYVKMVDYDKRKPYSQFQSIDDARTALAGFADLRASVGATEDWDFTYPILGDDPDVLDKLAQDMVAKLAKEPGYLGVETDQGEPSPEVRVELHRLRMAQKGLDSANLGETLDILVGGAKITTFQDKDRSYDVIARALPEQRDQPSVLSALPVGRDGQGNPVTLGEVATLSTELGPSTITRAQRRYQVTVQSNLAHSLPLQEATDKADAALKSLSPPAGYVVAPSGDSKLLQQTAVGAFQSLVLALAFMYLVLASQYEDLLDPLIILMTIPLSVPFALFSLVAADMTLNLFSILGMFLLFGVVKKNAILQIEQTNVLTARGRPFHKAIIEANKDRFRPILMTTVILVVSLLPVAVAGPTGAMRSPMAMVVVGGQSLCLLLTLLVVPVAMSLAHDFKTGLKRLFAGKKRSPATPEAEE